MQELNKRTIRTWSRLGQRRTFFGEAIPEIAENKNIMVTAADCGETSGISRFRKSFPDKYVNVGIAEQNLIGISAGLAKEGACVFATTYAIFTLRCLEQIRQNCGYMGFNVKVVGASAGFAMDIGGSTHHAIEDIAAMRAIPNMTVVSPADAAEAYLAAHAVSEINTPVYVRLTGQANCPMIYSEPYDFKIGKGVVLKKGTDIALIGNGILLAEVQKTAEILEEKGVSCTVVNMHTIKPLDTELLDELFNNHKLIVTVEEHNIIGGLGSAVAEYKATLSNAPRQIIIGVPDCFGKAGEYMYLLEQYGLTAAQIAETTRSFTL
ncbi:MAG: transketolase [Defluviitaleaceae bacterium]|nr:transketolase [Defluviitaleaceae bacterium]